MPTQRASQAPVAALALFVATLALLGVFRVHAPLHLDTARDLLLARDCVLGGHCPGMGPRSSFGELMQGALWSHLLELWQRLGLGFAGLERAADLLIAAAAALLPWVGRGMDRPVGALTWALWLPATLLTIGYPTLWNPTPWPLALALFHLAFVHAVRSGHWLPCTLAGAALALAIDLHVATALLLPFFLAAALAGARRPTLAALSAFAACAGVLALDSPGAFAVNRQIVARHPALVLLTLGCALAAGLSARRRLLAAPAASRARLVGLALCIYYAALLLGLSVVSGHSLEPRYLAPIVTPAAILGGAWAEAAIQRARRIRPSKIRAALALLIIVLHGARWARDRGDARHFRLVEAEPIAAALFDRGLAFGDLYRHLRGPGGFHLLSTLAALEPPDLRVAGRDDRDYLVIRAARSSVPSPTPPGWTLVDLGGSHVGVIVPRTTRVEIDPLEVCHTRAEVHSCETFPVDLHRFDQRDDNRWADRAYAGIAGLDRLLGRTPGAEIFYKLSLRAASGGSVPRILLFADECSTWRIDQASEAGVVFAVIAAPRCRWWLPPFVELEDPDPALDALILAATATP